MSSNGEARKQALERLIIGRRVAAEELIQSSNAIRELAKAGRTPAEPDRIRLMWAQQSYDMLTKAYRVMVP